VIGDGTSNNPFRPLTGNVKHEGSFQAFYDEERSVALVLFEADTEEKISELKIKMENLKEKGDKTKVKDKVKILSLGELELKGFQELSTEDTDSIGKALDKKFDRVKIETQEGSLALCQ